MTKARPRKSPTTAISAFVNAPTPPTPPTPPTTPTPPAVLVGPTLPDTSFPVVGIGASAGGLEAFTQLLKHLPSDTGMAYVLVQHLDPDHPSHLAHLLS